MIGSIRGKVIGVEGLTVLVETPSGLGYEVDVPGKYLTQFPEGAECFLYVHHVVREDGELLFGFKTQEERLLFREVIKLNGVGPRMGMALLSVFDLPSFVATIRDERINALTAVPGVGKKTAERIIVEMRDRIKNLHWENLTSVPASVSESSAVVTPQLPQSSAFECEDAIGALVSLGYKENQAMTAVRAVYTEGMKAEQIIVAALQQLNTPKR